MTSRLMGPLNMGKGTAGWWGGGVDKAGCNEVVATAAGGASGSSLIKEDGLSWWDSSLDGKMQFFN